MSRFKTKEFLKLQKEWYKKLESEGFKDIEIMDWQTGESGNLLKGVSSADIFKTYNADQQDHYASCRAHLRRLEEAGNTDQDLLRVWALYSEGVSFRDIQKELGIARARVSAMVKSEIERMKLLGGEMSQ